jgi:hypothetical protein
VGCANAGEPDVTALNYHRLHTPHSRTCHFATRIAHTVAQVQPVHRKLRRSNRVGAGEGAAVKVAVVGTVLRDMPRPAARCSSDVQSHCRCWYSATQWRWPAARIRSSAMAATATGHPAAASKAPTTSPPLTSSSIIPRSVLAASPATAAAQLQSRQLALFADAAGVDALAEVAFHGPEELRGLVASESVRSAAIVTVPMAQCLAVAATADGELRIVSPELPPNIKKALEGKLRRAPKTRARPSYTGC